MQFILFCEQTGARIDPKQSATVCAAQNRCDLDTNCPLMSKPSEPNQPARVLLSVDNSS